MDGKICPSQKASPIYRRTSNKTFYPNKYKNRKTVYFLLVGTGTDVMNKNISPKLAFFIHNAANIGQKFYLKNWFLTKAPILWKNFSFCTFPVKKRFISS
jgi:hypothetical protein